MRSPAALHSPSQTRTKRHRSSDSSAFCLRSVLLAPCQQQQVNSTSRTIRWFGTYLWPCESSPSPLKWTPHPPHPLPAALHSPSQTRTKRHLHANSPTSVPRPCIKHRRRAQLNPGRNFQVPTTSFGVYELLATRQHISFAIAQLHISANNTLDPPPPT